LAIINRCDILLNLSKLAVPGLSNARRITKVEPARLWLGWGDWNVIATVNENDLAGAQEIVAAAGGALVEIGKVVGPGPGKVSVTRNGITREAPRLESERFAKDSWFVGGIQSYVKLLLEVYLP
jgi:hypothetical protein